MEGTARRRATHGPPVGSPVVRLTTDGPIFREAERGTPWRYKAISAFKLPLRWQRIEDLTVFVRDARAIGANTFRVFLQHRFLDWNEGDGKTVRPYVMPLDLIRPFVDWCASQRFYVELTVLCDSQRRNPGDEADGFDQSDDWCIQRVADVLRLVRDAANVFVEIMNEPEFNGGFARVRRIVGALNLRDPSNRPVLMASGIYPSSGDESRESMEPLGYVGDHPPRKDTWPTETGKTAWYQYAQLGVAITQDELIGSDEQDSDSRDSSVENWEDGGAGVGLSSAGGTFHCEAGIQTIALGPRQLACGKAFFSAMDLIPIECPTWEYAHDGRDPHPLVEIGKPEIVGEVFSRVTGNRAYASAAQPSERWKPEPRNGWRIVEKLNQRGTILRLER